MMKDWERPTQQKVLKRKLYKILKIEIKENLRKQLYM